MPPTVLPTNTVVHKDMSSMCPTTTAPSSAFLQEKVLEFLSKHPRQTFSQILSGVVSSLSNGIVRCDAETDVDKKIKYAPLLRTAIQSLSNDFCIYIDGDKYSAL